MGHATKKRQRHLSNDNISNIMYEQKSSHLPFIQTIWRARVVKEDKYDNPAKDTWGLAFTKRADGRLQAELIGSSFSYNVLDSTVGDEYWGVEFFHM